MALSRRLKILEALAKASEANAEAMRLLLDGDSLPPPSPGLNELDEPSDKPTKPPGHPTRLVPIFTKELAAEEIRKAWGEARDEKERAKVVATTHRLVEQGLFSSEDVDALLKALNRITSCP